MKTKNLKHLKLNKVKVAILTNISAKGGYGHSLALCGGGPTSTTHDQTFREQGCETGNEGRTNQENRDKARSV